MKFLWMTNHNEGFLEERGEGMNKNLGVHETLELHELMVFKNSCLAKAATLSGLAQDDSLKKILTADLTAAKKEVEELQGFLS
jgi:similar to spore coat protein